VTHDREEDILYLAHQMWEEDAVSMRSARSCWQDAACEVLRSGRARYHDQNRTCNDASGKRQVRGGRLQFGPSPVIDLGKGADTVRISMITAPACVQIANPAIFLVSKADGLGQT